MDKLAKREPISEDTRFLHPALPCPMPAACRWVKGVCQTCQKRQGLSRMTIRVLEKASVIEGGMPVGKDEIAWAEWVAIGLLRQRTKGQQWPST